jgi:hypothetical protein
MSWDLAEPHDVALRIARCEEIDRARDEEGHPCQRIVELQPDRRTSPDEFQVPEGWAGNIESARIVFVSSNPSISDDAATHVSASPEDYPRDSWGDSRIADFITHRFDAEKNWTQADRFLCKDGTYASREVAFWSRVRKRARELVDLATPERDYVMTEVVHCKSHKEIGVKSSAPHCFAHHFETLTRLSLTGPH